MKCWAPDGYTVIDWPVGQGFVPTNDEHTNGPLTDWSRQKMVRNGERLAQWCRDREQQDVEQMAETGQGALAE